MSLLDLSGKGIVVLGAGGGGLGTATTALLAAHGAELLCVDSSEEQANASAASSRGHAFVGDVTKREDMEKLFARAHEVFGARLHGVVDIVGIARNGPIASFDDAAIARQFDIVFRHALLAIQIGGAALAERGGGAMTFISSAAGQRAVPNQALYGTAKAALDHLVRSAAQELGPRGVRVNAVSPGFVTTPRVLAALPKHVWDQIAAENPLGRAATPADVANAVLFLTSELAGYVTGNILTLDGGISQNLVLPGMQVPLSGAPART